MNIENKVNLVEKRNIFFIISLALIVISLIGFFVKGFNLDIDFIGGTTQQYNMQKVLTSDDTSKINTIIKSVTGEEASSIQITGADKKEVLIKTKELSSENRDKIFAELKTVYKLSNADRLSVDNVSATVGKDMTNSAILAIIAASVLMLVYITIRFNFYSGLAAVIALIHDVVIMLGAYIILDIPVGTTMIAAVLTILGYSINGTIIVFDRVRENKRLMSKEDFGNIVNTSMWQSMTRNINTAVSTSLVLFMLCILGVISVRNFALPLLIGVLAGAYSDIFISGNMWYLFERNKKNQSPQAKKKMA